MLMLALACGSSIDTEGHKACLDESLARYSDCLDDANDEHSTCVSACSDRTCIAECRPGYAEDSDVCYDAVTDERHDCWNAYVGEPYPEDLRQLEVCTSELRDDNWACFSEDCLDSLYACLDDCAAGPADEELECIDACDDEVSACFELCDDQFDEGLAECEAEYEAYEG